MRTFGRLAPLISTFLSVVATAATPPDRVNYQGVLRDASDAPLSGTFDMTFTFWSAELGGDPILHDAHHASGGAAVSVSGGLFNVSLGGGVLSDGSGPGTYGSLPQVFRDYTAVYLEVRVGAETLAPRTPLEAVPTAMNAAYVGGIGSSQFLRSDVNTATAPFTVFQVGGEFRLLNNAVHVNYDGPDGNQSLGFYDDGVPSQESLGWNDAEDRFVLSNDLYVIGTIHVQPGGVQPFHGYNVMTNGLPAPDSGDMANPADLYVADDLELDDTLYLNGTIVMDDDGPDGNQTIRFFDSGSPAGQAFGWDETNHRFHVSADFRIAGNLLFEGEDDAVRFVRNSYDILFDKDVDNDSGDAWFRFFTDGTSIEQMRIGDGDEAATLFDGPATANGIDYAEAFGVDDPSLEAGDVVRLVPGRPDLCRKTTGALDAQLLGVVSTRPGFVTGLSFDAESQADGTLSARRAAARLAGDAAEEKRLTIELREKLEKTTRPVALLGRVPVKVVGPVAAGDRLTSGEVPGRAATMRGAGPSLGIALEAWAGTGPGTVLAYIQPGWVGAEAFERGGPAPDPEVPATARASEGPAPATVAAPPSGFPQSVVTREGGLSQEFTVSGLVEVGDVVVADGTGDAALLRGTKREDPGVVGIVVSTAGIMTSVANDAERLAVPGRASVAMAGVVPCRVDASFGAVRTGDLLVLSETPGHAMRAASPPPGTVLGKALEPLAGGRGTIRVLVMAR